MARIGYARVSTRDQHPEAQADRLREAGCEKIFTDKGVSGMAASRPEWDRCREHLRPGDTLVTVRLDRIGRSVKNLIEVTKDLESRGVGLVVIDQQLDTTSAGGRLIFHVLAAIAEFERDLISDRTMDGLAAARARGRKGGGQPKLSKAQIARARQMYDETGPDGKRRYTVEEIGGTFKVSRQTIYRALGGGK
jgi:DNA invertase Pin-like site-specific DNA recombinase